MNRSDVKELYYILHIDNLKSILQHGILCYNKAKKFGYTSIADEEIQKRREKVVIPGGKRKLHDYANLYFNARNPMMFKRKAPQYINGIFVSCNQSCEKLIELLKGLPLADKVEINSKLFFLDV